MGEIKFWKIKQTFKIKERPAIIITAESEFASLQTKKSTSYIKSDDKTLLNALK
jgi:hypothetical protein